jgi:hypothetical protein
MAAGWLANMNPDRFLSPDPTTRNSARELYQAVASLPIVSPHEQVDDDASEMIQDMAVNLAKCAYKL